jgi:hypothetical protein
MEEVRRDYCNHGILMKSEVDELPVSCQPGWLKWSAIIAVVGTRKATVYCMNKT